MPFYCYSEISISEHKQHAIYIYSPFKKTNPIEDAEVVDARRSGPYFGVKTSSVCFYFPASPWSSTGCCDFVCSVTYWTTWNTFYSSWASRELGLVAKQFERSYASYHFLKLYDKVGLLTNFVTLTFPWLQSMNFHFKTIKMKCNHTCIQIQ